MDESQKDLPQTSENKQVLPDVVHSQHIPTIGAVVKDTDSETVARESEQEVDRDVSHDNNDVTTESISEHIPYQVESITESEPGPSQSKDLPEPEPEPESEPENVSKHISLNPPTCHATASPNQQDSSHHSTSWNLEINQSDNHISEESPVILALSSDTSKDVQKSKPASSDPSNITPQDSPRSEYIDSLNSSLNDNPHSKSIPEQSSPSLEKSPESLEQCSSGSEEIIKLDIRGQAACKFPLQAAKIIFGPPPSGSTVIGPTIDYIPLFQNSLSPCLVGANDGFIIEEVFEEITSPLKTCTPDKSLTPSSGSEKIEQDVLVEEIIVEEDLKERCSKDTPPKSFIPDETMSFTTMSTDYKTICEEYNIKLVHLEEAISKRDLLIEELTVSLQRSVDEKDNLKHENDHLIHEVQNLQHVIGEHSQSEHDTIKAHLSDFIKYQSLIKGDSTKYYSALMSGTTSLQSSNGEKDMDREEITVNYSKSDLRSSPSDEFQTGFENKLTVILNSFEGCIEDNMTNKLRESLIHLLCDEIGKMRVDFDTDLKELETQMNQDKQTGVVESRRLRELLGSVKAGSADIDVLRKELSVKHEKEMENLRTYFEKKCSDMERSYSEEVWRARVSGAAGGAEPDPAAGDARRRASSADFSPLYLETSTPVESTLKQINKKLQQQLEELKAEHIAYVNELQARHRETVASLDEQIIRLKAHIQTTENTEPNVSLYQQDIDLELEKEHRGRDELVRQQMLQEVQHQVQVLLSDPDAELSSWPLELVALRDRIHADKSSQEKELSIRDEAAGDADKWRQRRNNSFDQNRQLEEVTKERDGLRRVAAALQRAVAQLLAYCASAEDELNRTVLAHLLGPLLADRTTDLDSRPSSPNQTDLNTSVVSRGKHVHFAPDLDSILVSLDEEGVAGFLQQQRDISLDIKNELEHSLKRLRNEAQDLLELSARLTNSKARQESKMLESNTVQIKELDLDYKQKPCENCKLQMKNMEESMSDCLKRENLLRSDLEAALVKIAQLLEERDSAHSDVIAEGYGTGAGAGACRSLDDVSSPRTQLSRLAHDLDAALRDRDDMQQQLEAANRQLKCTRLFVEEQAAEREAERDEFAARLHEMREENSRLAARLQTNARILGEVEQLETQTREMNQIITDLETRKAAADEQLKTTEEKITLLRDIIANLENQLEQKTVRETEVLEQLEEMRKTIDERDSKMRAVLGELESLRSERVDQSEVTCLKCCQEEDRYAELVEKVKEQARWLEDKLARCTRRLERAHERSSACTSERTEDVSLREQKDTHLEMKSPEWSPRVEPQCELARVWARLEAHSRAADAALKRIADLEMQRAQLKDVAQEVRAERDVLQARMSEQALRISSLSARLTQQRNDAESLAHCAASQLSVQLHDSQAEVQRLKEELESKDKHLMRLKQNFEEREKQSDQKQSIYGNSCLPKDKVIILERELSNAQSKIAQLEVLIRGLESDKDELQATVREQQRTLAEKEDQLNEIMALKLEDEQNERSEIIEGKASARTLSDIVSISEFDENDLQMRRAELKAQNMSLTAPEFRDKTHLNRTLPPEVQRPNMSSLNVEFGDNFEVNYTPRADSLPIHLTSTQNRVLYARNANETTIFGTVDKVGNSVKHSTVQNIPDNCSMYPNRDVSDNKEINVEPKKINFSQEPCENKTENEEFTSLRELGITLDIKQENFPDILTQLKYEIKKSKSELDECKSELKNAEEQLCEFPALKEEVEELKSVLENTMVTMESDKKFYENQLESFSSNKKLLEKRLTEMSQEATEKSKDLHLLKEDILRRENMVLELAKEKRNLTSRISELEMKISELQSKNTILEKCENENKQMRDKIKELQKLEQLVTEKNQQIDSLNQHLDRLDDLQRCLDDKNEEMKNIKLALEEKTNELFQMQDSVSNLTRDIAKVIEENDQLSSDNKELKLQLSKLEKEQENASLKLQNSESELERVSSLNNELASRIEELKLLNDKLKDKETEIEILQEDFNSYHNEISALKEQLKMVSRSPSPRNKNGEDMKTADRQANSDKRQLAKIKKQISLLQHELDFHKKELNDKAFELAKAKLDLTEVRTNMSQLTKAMSEREAENSDLQQQATSLRAQLERLTAEKQQLAQQLEVVLARLREESNVSELKEKLRARADKCHDLEAELAAMKELVERATGAAGRAGERRALAVRSPTAELERALRDQLHYSHTLDEDIMEQILSASSDEREDIPRLALNSSNRSTSSIHSSSSERLHRLRSDNEKLELQVNNLECRLKDKDALITELNRVRDSLSQQCQAAGLRLEAERDNSARLALLLDSHKDSADTLHNQDSSMIDMLKRRLESAMKCEADVQEREQALLRRLRQLERAPPAAPDAPAEEGARGELALLRCKLEAERRRACDLRAQLDLARAAALRDADARAQLCTQLKDELAELRRLKHEAGVELARSKELAHAQSATIAHLEKKLGAAGKHKNVDTFTTIENEKTELAREISSLRRCLTADSPDAASDKQQVQQLQQQVRQLRAQLEARSQQLSNDEKEQAIRYLHARGARLESWRKALVWQKRYLQRALAGYAELERKLRLSAATPPPQGLKRFKCLAWAAVAAARMSFLVRRREGTRAMAANALFRPASGNAPQPMTPFPATPAPREPGSAARLVPAAARRLLHLKLPASPAGDAARRSPFNVNSPHEEQVLLSSPRSDAALSYLQRLDAVTRRLASARDDP